MATLKSIKNKYLSASDGDVLGVTTNTENVAALSFRLAGADSLTKFNLVDGFADDYIDATGVDAAGSTDEIRNSSNFYSGSATGAVLNAYTSGSGNFTAPAGVTSVEVLVVAAGGGGAGYGGGGGAGGVVHHTGYTVVPSSTYAYTVGTGGAGTAYNAGTAADGGNSTFGTGTVMTAEGGGGSSGSGSAGRAGGSGGGGNGGYASAGGPSDQPASTGGGTGYGNPGGAGVGGNYYGGGGGGAGESGTAGTTSPAKGGDGGDGKLFVGFEAYGTTSANAASSGSNGGWFGGGGGGMSDSSPTVGIGGAGGGADGETSTTAGKNALANTGGGGGGARNATGGTGGSGIVIVKEVDAYNNMTLQSNAFTAQAAPTTARIILDEWAYKGAQTLNTDIKAYASRDGTNFTQVTLADQGYLLGAGGINGNTQGMLHMDGTDGGTTFTDSCTEAGNTAKTWTASGNAHTSTDQYKFGTASAQFDGTGDYINTPATTDWDFGSDDFTIDFWMRPGVVDAQQRLFGNLNSGGSSSQFEFILGGSNNMSFSGSLPSGLAVTNGATLAINTWYHIAVTRSGNDWRLFVNGTAGSTASFSGTMGANTTTSIGRSGEYTSQLYTGFIDEVRITPGVAVWTSNFTPPVQEYKTSRRILSGSVDVSGQPSGTSMKYKLTTHNQSAAKQTRVYATSMAWA